MKMRKLGRKNWKAIAMETRKELAKTQIQLRIAYFKGFNDGMILKKEAS